MRPSPQEVGHEQNEVTILFLGTGAADWPYHSPPANLPDARHWRRLCSVLVNGHILIDCGPTTPEALSTFSADPAALTDVLLTHSHDDHLDAEAFRALAALRRTASRLRVWGHPVALQQVPPLSEFEFHSISVGLPVQAGPFQVEALAANHWIAERADEQALHYLFTGPQAQWLYATDGAWLPVQTWYRLRSACLDAVVWDATVGDIEGDYRVFEHNSLPMIRLMTQTLTKQGVLKPEGLVLLTHLARTLHPPHADLEQQLKPQGLTPAYDGLLVRLG